MANKNGKVCASLRGNVIIVKGLSLPASESGAVDLFCGNIKR